MTAYKVGGFVGAFIMVYLVSRLVRRLMRSRLGDSVGLVLFSLAVTLAISIALGGHGLSDTALPRYDVAFAAYAPAASVWLVLDLLALRGRNTRVREAAKMSLPPK